jgi:hypothetical protein
MSITHILNFTEETIASLKIMKKRVTKAYYFDIVENFVGNLVC